MEKENEIKIYTQDELSKVDNNILNSKQLDFILKPTPKIHTYTRPGKGGGNWTYVTGVYVKKTLNFLFGWNWDFEVVNFDMNLQAKQCIVQGKLTCRTKDQTIIRTQFGRADIKFYKDGKGTVDLGNDLKAATTDALKKCASELGLFSDVYAPLEYKQIKIVADNDADIKPELKPEMKKIWDAAIDHMVKGGDISKIKANYTLSIENEKKLKDANV